MVAIMSYSGYDIEDAVILNRASLDRGFARASVIRRNAATLMRYPSVALQDQLETPPKIEPHQVGRVNPLKFKRFQALGDDGLADIGKKMYNGDIIVNKHCPVITEEMKQSISLQNQPEPVYKQQPETYKGLNPAYVDRVILTSTPEEPCLIKIIQR